VKEGRREGGRGREEIAHECRRCGNGFTEHKASDPCLQHGGSCMHALARQGVVFENGWGQRRQARAAKGKKKGKKQPRRSFAP